MTVPHGLVPCDLEPPAALLVPVLHPFINVFTPEGRAELARRKAEREAEETRVRELLAAAGADWSTARERLDGNPAAVAVLDIHQPGYGEYASGPVCTECRRGDWGHDGEGEGDPAPWPCPTYQAVTGG